MKVRIGFVSNSSSCSFVCEACGAETSGWDMTYEEADMYECQNGHIFCTRHALRQYDKELDRYYGAVDESMCPLCQFEIIDTSIVLKYLLKNCSTNIHEVTQKLKANFKNQKEFMEWYNDTESESLS